MVNTLTRKQRVIISSIQTNRNSGTVLAPNVSHGGPPIGTNSLHASISPSNTGTPPPLCARSGICCRPERRCVCDWHDRRRDSGATRWRLERLDREVVRPHRSRTVVPESPPGIWRASCAQAAVGRRRAFTGRTPATSASRLACSTSAPRPCPYRFASAFGFWVARCEVRGIDRHRPDGEQPNDTWESPKSSIFHWAKPGGHQKEVGACARVRTDRYAHFRRLRE